jgi:hypothetical protein
MPPEFNVEQQTFLEARQRGKAWTWSALRPSVVCGFALGIPMNLTMVIAVYATISKHLGVPLLFPGKPGAFDKLLEVTDAGLLSRAMVWAATDPRAANQAFNINNGDLFRWEEMWPKIADCFAIEHAPALPLNLESVTADKQPVWDAIVAEHELEPTPTGTSPHGPSATPSSHGTTTSSPTVPRRADWAFTSTSRPSRCSPASSMSFDPATSSRPHRSHHDAACRTPPRPWAPPCSRGSLRDLAEEAPHVMPAPRSGRVPARARA